MGVATSFLLLFPRFFLLLQTRGFSLLGSQVLCNLFVTVSPASGQIRCSFDVTPRRRETLLESWCGSAKIKGKDSSPTGAGWMSLTANRDFLERRRTRLRANLPLYICGCNEKKLKNHLRNSSPTLPGKRKENREKNIKAKETEKDQEIRIEGKQQTEREI